VLGKGIEEVMLEIGKNHLQADISQISLKLEIVTKITMNTEKPDKS
jgi:hypothetical protein